MANPHLGDNLGDNLGNNLGDRKNTPNTPNTPDTPDTPDTGCFGNTRCLLSLDRYSRPQSPLTLLHQRQSIPWMFRYAPDLGGFEAVRSLATRAEARVQILQILCDQLGYSPRLLLLEPDPIQFLAGFVAAVELGCPVFLGNSQWGDRERQQVIVNVRPDWILGHSDGDPPREERRGVPTVASPTPEPHPLTGLIGIPTGGSSGQIRFALHTWETLTAAVIGLEKGLESLVPGRGTRRALDSFCTLPLYHVSGLMQVIRSLLTGGQIYLLDWHELPSALARGSETRDSKTTGDGFPTLWNAPGDGVRCLSLVPTQLQRLLTAPEQPPGAIATPPSPGPYPGNRAAIPWLKHFDLIFLGGAPAWPNLLTQARQLGLRLAPTYGMTETAGQIATLAPVAFLAGQTGCGPLLPHVTLHRPSSTIRHPTSDVQLPITSPALFLGYYTDRPEWRELSQPFCLDDLGYCDRHGSLHILGRQSDKIISGGENVFPAEVEAAIRATGAVRDVAVLGLPDSQWGEVVTAVYVPGEVSLDTLRHHLRSLLSGYKCPKHWIAVSALPRTPQGKLNRQDLRAIASRTLPP